METKAEENYLFGNTGERRHDWSREGASRLLETLLQAAMWLILSNVKDMLSNVVG